MQEGEFVRKHAAAAIAPMAAAGGRKDASAPALSAPMACPIITPFMCRPRTWPWIASSVCRMRRSGSGSDAGPPGEAARSR
jgi:hypothetical protein